MAVAENEASVSADVTPSDAEEAEAAPVTVEDVEDAMLYGLPVFVMLRMGGANDVDQAGVELRVILAVLSGGNGAGSMPLGAELMDWVVLI